MSDAAIEETLSEIRGRLTPTTNQPDATYGFLLDGLHCVELRVRSGKVTVQSVPFLSPNRVLSAMLSTDTLRAMLAGRLTPMWAVMSGKLTIEGDRSQAARLGELLRG